MFPSVKPRFLKVRTPTWSVKSQEIVSNSERNSQKENQASKTREEGQQEGQEEVEKQNAKSPGGETDIDPASTERCRSVGGAATGVIFGVDVVPLSILAS